MKELLCKAFCDQLTVRELPSGYAVSTALDLSSGEPLGFYVMGPDSAGRYRIEDDGASIALIEAAGLDLERPTRAGALASLFEEYGAAHNPESGELSTPPLPKDEVPRRALQFVALLLRLQDLALLTPERAASSFKEDVLKAVRSLIGDRAVIKENQAPAGTDFPADILIEASQRSPVAVFLAMSEQRVLEAIVAQMALTYEANVECSIIALLEKDSSIGGKMRQRASNRLIALPIYEGDEKAAVLRIEREVFGRAIVATVH